MDMGWTSRARFREIYGSAGGASATTAVGSWGLGRAGVLVRVISFRLRSTEFVRQYRTPLLLTISAFALRLPFLSNSIDEIDAANFVNALDNGYNVPLLRPHAPGYPVYIFAGSLVRPFTGDSVTALALLSAILGSLTVFPFYALSRELIGRHLAVVGTLLLIVNPLFWSFGETALSDVPSTFAIVTMAWLLCRGRESDQALIAAVIVASLAVGIRQQNIAFLPLLIYPLAYRAFVSRSAWKRLAIVSAEVFLATTVLWVASMVVLGSEGIDEYVAAVNKQWVGAVKPYDIFNSGSPLIVAAPERVERFVVGYVFTHPWTGIDARTGMSTALQLPWIFGLSLFISRASFRNSRHLFLMLWIGSISYQILTIHFLPRYGLPILPALVISSMVGYGLLRDELIRDRNRITVISLVVIGSLLILLGVKHQPPVAVFEWSPPDGSHVGAILVASGLAVLLASRLLKTERPATTGSVPANDQGRMPAFIRSHFIEIMLGIFVIPTAIVGMSMVSSARSGSPPNQRLVEYVQETWDMDRVTICWDGQTHGYFEVLTPGITPRGFWTINELKEGVLAGDTLLVTDYCVRFAEVESLVYLEKVAEFSGTNPVWSKAPSISLYAGHLGDPSR